MNIKERLKRWSKLRFAILYPFGVFVVLFSHSDDRSIMASVWFIVAGLLLRLWANGYAIKMDKLTTSGPYALVRHPLYVGTMLIVIGFIIMLRIYYIGALFLIVMLLVYRRTVKKEESMLEAKFKEDYLGYKEKVRAFLPSFSAYREGEKWKFSFRRLIQSQEYKPFLWVIILMIAFHLKEEIMVERETIDAKICMLFIIAFILGMCDVVGEFIRHKNRQ